MIARDDDHGVFIEAKLLISAQDTTEMEVGVRELTVILVDQLFDALRFGVAKDTLCWVFSTSGLSMTPVLTPLTLDAVVHVASMRREVVSK